MRVLELTLAAATLCAVFSTSTLAQGTEPTSRNTPSSAQEADKMRSGDKAGTTPNSAIPGANPASDGNATQDTRTSKDKNR